jgi:predicted nuclease of predicted toxin-antitoxin system
VKLWIDEDLSPTLVFVCQEAGYDAASNRDRGMLGGTDAEVLARCVDEDRVLVTNNAGDFRALCLSEGMHPGLILMPAVPKLRQRNLMSAVLVDIESKASAAGVKARDIAYRTHQAW